MPVFYSGITRKKVVLSIYSFRFYVLRGKSAHFILNLLELVINHSSHTNSEQCHLLFVINTNTYLK